MLIKTKNTTKEIFAKCKICGKQYVRATAMNHIRNKHPKEWKLLVDSVLE